MTRHEGKVVDLNSRRSAESVISNLEREGTVFTQEDIEILRNMAQMAQDIEELKAKGIPDEEITRLQVQIAETSAYLSNGALTKLSDILANDHRTSPQELQAQADRLMEQLPKVDALALALRKLFELRGSGLKVYGPEDEGHEPVNIQILEERIAGLIAGMTKGEVAEAQRLATEMGNAPPTPPTGEDIA